MPWIHFHAGDSGYVKACCVANITYGNINNQSLKDIWNDKPINDLRDKFSKGESDKRCFVCINREKAGGKSIRQETHEKYKGININELKTPFYFDIRFSNVCNFKCKTCWHGASSKWFEDAKKLGRNVSEKAIIKNINDFNDFIAKTGEALLNAKEIYFAGGEPLVTEEHYFLLEFLIKNKATNIHLRYNTNFSKLSFKKWNVIELWAKFSRVEVMASVDDFGGNGEYIRKGFDWQLFLKNRETLRQLNHVTFKVSPTISILNIKYLPDFYKKILELQIINLLDFYINILERPYHFNVKAMLKQDKEIIKNIFENFFKWCEENDIPKEIIKSFNDCINFMNEEDLSSKYWKKYKAEIKLLDGL